MQTILKTYGGFIYHGHHRKPNHRHYSMIDDTEDGENRHRVTGVV